MTKLLEFLKGKKTIITGVVMIVLGLLQNEKNLVLEGLSFIFLRMGINNIR